jgi:hypothetical protein
MLTTIEPEHGAMTTQPDDPTALKLDFKRGNFTPGLCLPRTPIIWAEGQGQPLGGGRTQDCL